MKIEVTAQKVWQGEVISERELGTCICDSISRALQMYDNLLEEEEILVYRHI